MYCVGKLSRAERAQKILKYRQKRHERNFTKRIKYQCRKTLADSRPRVRGRFARNDDAAAVQPHESRKALAAKKSHATKWSPLSASRATAVVAVGVAIILLNSPPTHSTRQQNLEQPIRQCHTCISLTHSHTIVIIAQHVCCHEMGLALPAYSNYK